MLFKATIIIGPTTTLAASTINVNPHKSTDEAFYGDVVMFIGNKVFITFYCF